MKRSPLLQNVGIASRLSMQVRMNWVRHSPPDIGGVDATSRRSREASFNGADGVVGNGTTCPEERIPKHFGNPNHPVCAAAVASRLFIDGAATPPMSGGELPPSHSFTASMAARILSILRKLRGHSPRLQNPLHVQGADS